MRASSRKATALAALRITAIVIIIAGMVAGLTFSIAELRGAGRFTQMVLATEPAVARQATVTAKPAAETVAERPNAVIINRGDSLWQIAATYYPNRDPRTVVYEIRQVNSGIDPGRLQIGQIVKLP
ncbi:MAG: LysM peptidoglycan-binding domain-containing protein [Clostridiales bacterium]|nr:LysM peptidoglycan-binding domain-containing protein [Clostridiales bacterium]